MRGRLYLGHCSLFCSFRKSLIRQILNIAQSCQKNVYVSSPCLYHSFRMHTCRLYSYYYCYYSFLLFFHRPADIQCPVSILGFFISSCQRNSRPRGSKAKRPPVQLKRTEMEHYGPIQFSSNKRTKLLAVYFRNMM